MKQQFQHKPNQANRTRFKMIQAVANMPTTNFLANPDHERTDAILEFAQETGLWGLPGAEREPDFEEYDEMIEAFEEENNENRPHPDAIDLDEMFNLMEQRQQQQQQQGEQQEPHEECHLNWQEITTDFQDYAIDVMVEEGRMGEEMTDEYALSIWQSYIEDCWENHVHSELNALAGQNELRGILPSTM